MFERFTGFVLVLLGAWACDDAEVPPPRIAEPPGVASAAPSATGAMAAGIYTDASRDLAVPDDEDEEEDEESEEAPPQSSPPGSPPQGLPL